MSNVIDSLPAVSFPFGEWIPNPLQVADTGAALVTVVGQALDQQGLGEEFARRVFTHGDTPPVQLNESKTRRSQLIVVCKGIELGKAGMKQYAYEDGALGKYALVVVEYAVELWVAWPTPAGGISARLAEDASLMAAAFDLAQIALVAFSALRALSLGGVQTIPPVLPIVQDHMLVGPAQPLGPNGGLAGWGIKVEAQF
jgi:hypothetical protein